MKKLIAAIVLLPAAAWGSDVTIPNEFTGGTAAVASEVNANFDAVETAIDDNDARLDVQEDAVYILPNDGELTHVDLSSVLSAACEASGNLWVNCKEVVLTKGNFSISQTFFISDVNNDGPDAATGEGVWGLKLRGSGGAYIQTPITSAATSRCATTISWVGESADPMIWIHAGRGIQLSDMCLVLDGEQNGTTGNPPASHGIIATSNSGEISEGIRIHNVDIYGLSSSWANNATYTSTLVALLPSDFSGDPPYATSTQVDDFVIKDSRLIGHRLFLGANGSSGTNGVTIMNVSGAYTDYGLWAESSDLQVYAGKYVTQQAYGAATDQGTSCTNSEAWLKIGSTSSDQAKIVSVIGTTIEGNCGEAIATVDATTDTNQRDSTTVLTNTSINWGAAGEDHVINYTHHGALAITGGFFGVRNSENYTTAGRSFLSILPDTRTADTLSLRLEGTNLDSWTTGSFRAETNAQVDLIDADDISLSDAYAWTGAHTFTTPSADDSDTSVATTAYVQGEINGAGGDDLTCASGVCNVDATVTRDAELSAYTTGTSTPEDGTTACNTGDMHLETDAFKIYFCTDGATDKWYGVALSDTP